ncbi:MAG: epoxyqueuosine reductase [Clostridiales bacterium]|nr:epoxyqueuosine reductase [Clostridiales bacterium]
MTKEMLLKALEQFSEESPLNYVDPAIAIEPRVAGAKMYEAPILGYGAADDALFAEMQKEEAVGYQFELPEYWLPGAKTVISFFAPKSQEVREDNGADLEAPSLYWLHARKEGQDYIDAICRKVIELLEGEGYKAVAPSLDSRFHAGTIRKNEAGEEYKFPFTSNWSERHVGYICGMGTFGLSKGLITEKGIAGRFGSIITDWVTEPKKREYTGIYDYCTKCGACVRNCPADAITLEEGKNHPKCAVFLKSERFTPYAPRYGCGKCQVKVPCEHGIPGRK